MSVKFSDMTPAQRKAHHQTVLLEIAAAAKAFVATQGDRVEPEWGDLTLALSKLKP